MTGYALVAVENTLFAFDKLFSYRIPFDKAGKVMAGMRVVVPFGRGNKKRIGLVMRLSDEPSESDKAKPEGSLKIIKNILSVIDEQPVISEELIKLCEWLRDNTFCTYYDAFRTILPPGLNYSLKTRYNVNKKFSGQLTVGESLLYTQLLSADKTTFDALIQGNKELVSRIVKKGALLEITDAGRRVGDENIRMARVAVVFSDDLGEPLDEKLSPKQREVMEFLSRSDGASVHEIRYNCGVSSAVVKRLAEKGLIELYEKQIFRLESNEPATENPDDIVLSHKQQQVFDGIKALMDDTEPRCALLRGVTGSGKTSVFIKLINEALKQGKSAMMLVPEISLTPQTVGKFRRLFGNEVAVMHSSLSLGERADEYRRVCSGKARIVIGTRSAVFAPVQNLGIVVIDEEGEGSYKSESAPRYHARDVAKQRCFAHNALLVLASATPSLESYYNAKIGRYSLFEIDERYNNAVLPEVHIIDMAEERKNGNTSTFSTQLVDEIRGCLARGEQSILLLNRRGYRTSVRCAACGKPLECPNCSMPLTYHKVNDCVICHCCGYMRRADKVCPACGSRFFNMTGEGTQLIEDELSEMFPQAKILRMDADTASGKDAFERCFKAFAAGEYDIMVGTQMIAKGLDFPRVTLVGVLKTDNSLYASDFRAYERTFSLITQVVGRAGRGELRGKALIQTFSPEHFVINLAACQNYREFYEEEIALRETRVYPPFCDVTIFGFSSLESKRCENAAREFSQLLLKNALPHGSRVPLAILGPAPNAVGKVNGKFRYSLIVKCRNNKLFRSVAEQTLKDAYKNNAFANVAFYADIGGNVE